MHYLGGFFELVIPYGSMLSGATLLFAAQMDRAKKVDPGIFPVKNDASIRKKDHHQSPRGSKRKTPSDAPTTHQRQCDE